MIGIEIGADSANFKGEGSKAEMAELADAADLKFAVERRAGSTPALGIEK
jgi:hypothetical protein